LNGISRKQERERKRERASTLLMTAWVTGERASDQSLPCVFQSRRCQTLMKLVGLPGHVRFTEDHGIAVSGWSSRSTLDQDTYLERSNVGVFIERSPSQKNRSRVKDLHLCDSRERFRGSLRRIALRRSPIWRISFLHAAFATPTPKISRSLVHARLIVRLSSRTMRSILYHVESFVRFSGSEWRRNIDVPESGFFLNRERVAI